ncbi:hypothetical protein [Enterococcus faecalis]|uniref:hypothetical protein n=1 Tax=Enterococcus faecalis TaxID=1351 RepID=UPI001A97BE2D|nr:hypothetical protein [Enterococcus faecalis]MBO1137326.1 hypothetical protein [Enterococcus faecalis]
MSKLKEINWARSYIFGILLFYLALSIITFYIYNSSIYYNRTDIIYRLCTNLYFNGIVLFSIISFCVYLFSLLKKLLKKKQNIYSNKYDLLAIKRFYLVQLLFFLVEIMVSFDSSGNAFPLIFTSFFVVVMYYYYFYGKSLLEKQIINYLKLKKLFLIMELFFSLSLILYFKMSVLFSLIVLTINWGSTLLLDDKDMCSVKEKRFINKWGMIVVFLIIRNKLYSSSDVNSSIPMEYSFNAPLLYAMILLFLTNNRLIAKFYDKNSDSKILEHSYR